MSDTAATGTTSDDAGADTRAATDGPPSGADEVSRQEIEEIEAERDRRLDPENRPDNAEVDNTDRDFDPTHGRFTDSEVDAELGPFSDPD